MKKTRVAGNQTAKALLLCTEKSTGQAWAAASCGSGCLPRLPQEAAPAHLADVAPDDYRGGGLPSHCEAISVHCSHQLKAAGLALHLLPARHLT